MPNTSPARDVSANRPVEGSQALTGPPSPVARRATSRLDLAGPNGLYARRRSGVPDALVGQLTVRSERDHRTYLVAPVGELDIATAQRVEDELKLVEASNSEEIILDLSGLTFMDSSGLHLIARANARCATRAIRLRLLPGPPCVQRVLALAAAATTQPLAR